MHGKVGKAPAAPARARAGESPARGAPQRVFKAGDAVWARCKVRNLTDDPTCVQISLRCPGGGFWLHVVPIADLL